jgi:hypothetical protein
MEQLNCDIILKLGGLITIIFLAFIAGKTLKDLKIEPFGTDGESKSKAMMKIVRSIFIFLCLCLTLIAGIYKLFQEQVILLLFIAGLGALGINLIKELKE